MGKEDRPYYDIFVTKCGLNIVVYVSKKKHLDFKFSNAKSIALFRILAHTTCGFYCISQFLRNLKQFFVHFQTGNMKRVTNFF